jgi:hypothetical protein
MLSCGQRVCDMDCPVRKQRWQNADEAGQAPVSGTCRAAQRPNLVLCGWGGFNNGWLFLQCRSWTLPWNELDFDNGDGSNPRTSGLDQGDASRFTSLESVCDSRGIRSRNESDRFTAHSFNAHQLVVGRARIDP